MNFEEIKGKMLGLKEKALSVANEAIEKGAEVIQNSSFTINDLEGLESFISKSKNYYNDVTKKEVSKRVIVIFAEKGSDFFKKALYILPVVYTKSWTRNIEIKIVDTGISGLDLLKYQTSILPSLVMFENEKVLKVVAGEEKINKIVTGLTLDIEKSVLEIA
nr:hypothetical protein [Candidatus Gracilibacteria bacterium]